MRWDPLPERRLWFTRSVLDGGRAVRRSASKEDAALETLPNESAVSTTVQED